MVICLIEHVVLLTSQLHRVQGFKMYCATSATRDQSGFWEGRAIAEQIGDLIQSHSLLLVLMVAVQNMQAGSSERVLDGYRFNLQC